MRIEPASRCELQQAREGSFFPTPSTALASATPTTDSLAAEEARRCALERTSQIGRHSLAAA